MDFFDIKVSQDDFLPWNRNIEKYRILKWIFISEMYYIPYTTKEFFQQLIFRQINTYWKHWFHEIFCKYLVTISRGNCGN